MARYVDGFVIPVPKSKLKAYLRQAKGGAKVWMKHGALEYHECVGDDLRTPMGPGFSAGIKAKPNETVVFSWIVFKSRAHRDQVNKKVMKEMNPADFGEMAFDEKRMLYGGFKSIVDA
jgi:uncharacterized protein YbaA (DUF1428 family)